VTSGAISWSTSHQDLTVEECLDCLSCKQLGRVAFTQDSWPQAGPVILPVNYVMEGDAIIVRTSPYGFIAQSLRRRETAFAVDEIDERTGCGWTVLVRGSATEVPGQHVYDLQRRPSAWREGVHSLFLRISPRLITGRRYGRLAKLD
jgi:nitroimidazol reductase NimA-like FMN-containing flavoprotein (pyridoxamine 5'-phosphate oxidase superfamily)